MDNDYEEFINDFDDDAFLDFFGFMHNPFFYSFIDIILRKLSCRYIYLPFAREVDVINYKQQGFFVDYNNPDEEECGKIQRKTGIKALDNKNNKNKYEIVFANLSLRQSLLSSLNISMVENICNACQSNGYSVLCFPADITTSSEGKKWFKEFEKNGLYVNSIIDLPRRFMMKERRIIIFSKKNKDNVFLAKLDDAHEADAIIENFLSDKDASKNERLGKWIQKGLYSDYSAYDYSNKEKRFFAKLKNYFNGELVPLEIIVKSIEAPWLEGFNIEEEAEATVYIPKKATTKVVTRPTEYDAKPSEYFRIIVKQEMIIPDFLAYVLNTESGIELRLRAMVGKTHQFNITNIKALKVPLPSINFQNEILKLDSELNQLSQEVANLREKLKQQPIKYKDVRKEITQINNHGDRFDQWVESLPYPIATILKRYQVAGDVRDKQDILLYFFEAYSIFGAAILVEGYRKYPDYKKDIQELNPELFEKSSFGNWVLMNILISKSIRRLLSDKQSMDTILDCFCTEDRNIINSLINKDICKILQDACNNRNSWRGHSGYTGREIYEDHVRILESYLNDFQNKIQDTYNNLQLIRPISLKRKNDEFINTVEILTGSNPIFKTCKFKGESLNEGELYIRMLDTDKVFKLPELLMMKNSPANVQNACYFYNRVEGDKTRYISYHFEDKPEEFEPGSTAYEKIKDFLGKQ